MSIEVVAKAGSRGNTVSVVKRKDSRFLYLRWWDGSLRDGKGDYSWHSLGHDDLNEAEASALEMAALLKRGTRLEKAPVSLAKVMAEYESHVTVRRSPLQRKAHERRMDYLLEFFKANKPVVNIDMDALDAYIEHRRAQGVSDTTIGHETVFLRGIFSWAAKKRGADGQPLIPFSPLPARMKRLLSGDPHTPVAERWAYLAVRRYADQVDRQKLFRPLIVLVHEHGWRLSEWLHLKASDIDLQPRTWFPYGALRGRGATHKEGKGGWFPLTPSSRRAAILLLRRARVIGDTYIFRAPKAKGVWQPQHALDLLSRIEKRATDALREKGFDVTVKLGGFHALRRKWASDRKDEPLVDVAHAGRWHPQTLLGYQKPDAATTLRVTVKNQKRNQNR